MERIRRLTVAILQRPQACLMACSSWSTVLGLGWRTFSSHRGPGHYLDAVLLQEGRGDPGSVGACVVLQQGEVGVLQEAGHDFQHQHLVDEPLCIHAVSMPWANVLDDN